MIKIVYCHEISTDQLKWWEQGWIIFLSAGIFAKITRNTKFGVNFELDCLKNLDHCQAELRDIEILQY